MQPTIPPSPPSLPAHGIPEGISTFKPCQCPQKLHAPPAGSCATPTATFRGERLQGDAAHRKRGPLQGHPPAVEDTSHACEDLAPPPCYPASHFLRLRLRPHIRTSLSPHNSQPASGTAKPRPVGFPALAPWRALPTPASPSTRLFALLDQRFRKGASESPVALGMRNKGHGDSKDRAGGEVQPCCVPSPHFGHQ